MTTKQIKRELKKIILGKVSVTRPTKGTLKDYTLIQSTDVNLASHIDDIKNVLPTAIATSASMIIA